MFNYGNVPPGSELIGVQRCYRCNMGLVTPVDVFASHCMSCLVGIVAEVETDLAERGPVQQLLARHREFADWLRRNGR